MTVDSARAVLDSANVPSRQRIPVSLDPFSQAGVQNASTLTPFRTTAVAKVFLGLQRVKDNISLISGALAALPVPAVVVGSLAQPDGTAGANLQVQFDPATVGVTGPVQTTLTKDTGAFTLDMPAGGTMPAAGLAFTVHGADGNATVTVAQAQVAANGLLGTVVLASPLAPLPVSILAALEALLPVTIAASQPSPQPPASLPKVTIGEEGACSQSFAADATIDSFPYGVFFRLVEPQMSIVNQVITVPVGEQNGFIPLPQYATTFAPAALANAATNGGAAGKAAADGNGNAAADDATVSTYTDRVPVEQPLSADGFLDQIAGIGTDGNFTADENVPMAATLGLGYVLWMSQQWTFQGLGLGDLVYSLPLAPGEQTEVAVFERTDTAQVFESESFSEQQAQEQSALSDTSTAATFNSAFSEAINGGSAFHTDSTSWSAGASLIVVSGGAGGSSSSGNSSEWLQGQRDSAQQAAQTTQSSAESQASARRSASRTGMRLASATESDSVTTRTVTNHNHTRALTMQYWQVLRMFDVTTAIDGLTLACLIPMQIVRFMPSGQPQALTDPAQLGSRPQVLQRYANIIKHLDVLQQAVPRRLQHGLAVLEQFASDPTAEVDSEGGVAEDVIRLSLAGSFLSCETVSVVAVTRRNTRVGPVRLTPVANGQPPDIPPDTFASQEELLGWLLGQRQASASSVTLQGSLALPATMNRTDIVGFEITRSWDTVSYTLASPMVGLLSSIEGIFGAGGSAALQNVVGDTAERTTITLTSSTLEPALGGPNVGFFSAAIEEFGADGSELPPQPNETYANDQLSGTVLPPQPYPVPALQIAPVLRYSEILEIEKAAQHIVRNTTLYSKAVWMSLSADERAILLDGYTIGVPPDGVSDASQLVPLLNCVQNKLLGFFGNSMIMPFMIPQGVADSMEIDPAAIQQALLAYQQAAFAPPQSIIALPTQGVLGEGVLGHCPSAEKVDLTRFWNWQDSPADTAPAISPVTLPTATPSIAAGLTAPNSLGSLPSLINNVLQAPTPNTSLLQSLGADAAAQKDFSAGLTGAAQLAQLQQGGQGLANAARASALQTTQQLTGQAMATVGNIVGGMYGSPDAGSAAASAMKGGSGSTTSKKTSSKKTTKKSGGSSAAGSDGSAAGSDGPAADGGLADGAGSGT